MGKVDGRSSCLREPGQDAPAERASQVIGMANFAQDMERGTCQKFKAVKDHSTDVGQRSAMCTSILTIYVRSSQMVVAPGICHCKHKQLIFLEDQQHAACNYPPVLGVNRKAIEDLAARLHSLRSEYEEKGDQLCFWCQVERCGG